MPQTQYNLHLKGFVGGADFDRNYVMCKKKLHQLSGLTR